MWILGLKVLKEVKKIEDSETITLKSGRDCL